MKRRPKGWSVKDMDHVPIGSNVVLVRRAEEMHPSLGRVHEVFGMDDSTTRSGVITHRWYGDGAYMVGIVGTRIEVRAKREDFLYPVPDGVVAFTPHALRTLATKGTP